MKFLADIEVEEGLKDSSGDLGSNGQVLSSTGSGTNWITSNPGDITGVTAGTGMTGGGTSGTVTLNVIGGTGITANANNITIDATVATLAGTQTFTNKSGNISMWTNNSGYTTNTGTTTASNTQTFTNKSGNISQWTNDSGYVTSSGGSMSSWILKEGNGTETSTVTNGETVTFAQGTGIQTELTSTSSGGTLTITNTSPNIVQTTITGNAGSATVLQTARTIAGVSFNGSANISLNNNAITNGAGYITNAGVTQITAGTNITISPVGGTGNVTINAASGGSSLWSTDTNGIIYSGSVGVNIASSTLVDLRVGTGGFYSSGIIYSAGNLTVAADLVASNGVGTVGQALLSGGSGNGCSFRDNFNSDTTGEPSGSDKMVNIVSLTQAEYDNGTPVSTTLYIIT